MNKIIQLSRCLKWFFLFALVIAPLFPTVVWLFHIVEGPHFALVGPMHYPVDQIREMGMWRSLLGWCIIMIPTALSMLTCYYLVCLFRCYQQREIFTSEPILYLYRAGQFLLLKQLVVPISQAAEWYLLTFYAKDRIIAITYSQPEIMELVVAVTLFLISYIMREAYLLQQESKWTI